MMAIRRKLPKQFEEPPASAVNHLDEIPRRAERVHKRKATLPDYWWHVEYVAGTSALPADEKVTGLRRTRELLRTQMEEDGDPEDDRQKSAVKNLEARIKTRLESARKAKKTEAERSAGGHPVQPPGGVRKDTPRASGGRSKAAQRAAHSVSKQRVTSPTEWTAGTGPGEAHRAAENDFGPAPKRAKPVYQPFFADFGPLNLGQTYRYCELLRHILKVGKVPRAVTSMRAGARSERRSCALPILKDTAAEGKKVFHITSGDPHKLANSAVLALGRFTGVRLQGCQTRSGAVALVLQLRRGR
eukprot:jgi/Mesvir1/9627/Mv07817-RA.1